MKSYEYDIVIVGGGCIGASLLYELSRQGFRNLTLLDHGRRTISATAHSGGMLRVFHENIEHIKLALAHRQLLKNYQDLGVISEKSYPNGNLYFFNKDRIGSYQSNLQLMTEVGYPFQVLGSKEGREQFPEYFWGENECAIFEPEAQQLSPSLFVEDLLFAASHAGINILDNFEVKRICQYRECYRIIGEDSSITAKCLVLAGGARLLPRLCDLGLSLNLESRNLTTFIAKKTDDQFVLPNYFDRETLDFGRFGKGEDVVLANPDSERILKKEWEQVFNQNSALDCYSPNRLGLMGQIPGHPRLLIATGWGGTGFKFALEVGRHMGNLVRSNFYEGEMMYA